MVAINQCLRKKKKKKVVYAYECKPIRVMDEVREKCGTDRDSGNSERKIMKIIFPGRQLYIYKYICYIYIALQRQQ